MWLLSRRRRAKPGEARLTTLVISSQTPISLRLLPHLKAVVVR